MESASAAEYNAKFLWLLRRIDSLRKRTPRVALIDAIPELIGNGCSAISFVHRVDGSPVCAATLQLGEWREWLEGVALEQNGGRETLEVCFHGRTVCAVGTLSELNFPLHDVGIRGLRFRTGTYEELWIPSRMIAENTNAEKVFAAFEDQVAIEPAKYEGTSQGVHIEAFDAQTVVFDMKSGIVFPTYRCRPILPKTLNVNEVYRNLASKMHGWLIRNMAESGEIPHMYLPSQGKSSNTNNPIRQFMATIALARAGKVLGITSTQEASRLNLESNLKKFCSLVDGHVSVLYDGTVKLGAVALAAMAIIEVDGLSGSYQQTLAGLVRTTEAMWKDDGAFRTFLVPRERNDNQNFYPGETLLLWARLISEAGNQKRIEMFVKSFTYYYKWHQANRNPAFVPWHTQAYSSVMKHIPNHTFTAAIFDMNDWLIQLQQVRDAPFDDMIGRFYSPRIPSYGPPHASATGVYLEGLVDAHQVATEAGDEKRAKRYELAVKLGIENLAMLQYSGEIDAFYVRHPGAVIGGVRTNPYDNRIRIDNVQHGLMAILKIIGVRQFQVS